MDKILLQSLISAGIFIIVALAIAIPVTLTLTKDVKNTREALFETVDPNQISEYLKTLSAEPHLAGSYRDEVELVDFIKKEFEKSLDKVEVFSHKVKLAYAMNAKLDDTSENGLNIEQNSVEITDGEGKIVWNNFTKISPGTEVDLFVAYTKAGTAKGKPLYVNYGQESDFDALCDVNVNIIDTDTTKKLCKDNILDTTNDKYISHLQQQYLT